LSRRGASARGAGEGAVASPRLLAVGRFGTARSLDTVGRAARGRGEVTTGVSPVLPPGARGRTTGWRAVGWSSLAPARGLAGPTVEAPPSVDETRPRVALGCAASAPGRDSGRAVAGRAAVGRAATGCATDGRALVVGPVASRPVARG